MLGADLTLDNTRQLSLTGTTTVGSTLTISGGTLNTNIAREQRHNTFRYTGTLFTGTRHLFASVISNSSCLAPRAIPNTAP